MWLCVQTETRRENLASHHLMANGFSVYLPKLKFKQDGKLRIVPLFPSYLFVRPEPFRWMTVRWTIGCIRVLMSAPDQPAQVSEKILNEIRARENGGFVVLPSPQRFRNGDRVRIVRGSFSGCNAIFQAETGRERVLILLDLLGRAVPIELPTVNVEPLDIARSS
jgi:transcriptional antiterminator RfaH